MPNIWLRNFPPPHLQHGRKQSFEPCRLPNQESSQSLSLLADKSTGIPCKSHLCNRFCFNTTHSSLKVFHMKILSFLSIHYLTFNHYADRTATQSELIQQLPGTKGFSFSYRKHLNQLTEILDICLLIINGLHIVMCMSMTEI